MHFRSTISVEGGCISLGCLIGLNGQPVAVASDMFMGPSKDGVFIAPLGGTVPVEVEPGGVNLSWECTSRFNLSTRIGAVSMVTSFSLSTGGAQ
ncbi:MAG: hypothetical protein ABJ013_10190 [Halioglobus sp.]